MEIIKAFADIKDPRRRAGQQHNLPLCLALFTLAIAAGNKGFLAIGDWISSYHEQLIVLLYSQILLLVNWCCTAHVRELMMSLSVMMTVIHQIF
ncbi:MAG: transposase family protein [Nostoc sp. JL31]|nr:transposase family protein [Nostoc sp. JL31]